MPHLMLSWVDDTLLTLDLSDGRRVALVLPDPELAEGLARAVAHAAEREVEVVEIDAPAEGIADALEVLLGIARQEGSVQVLFPEDPLWRELVVQLLRG